MALPVLRAVQVGTAIWGAHTPHVPFVGEPRALRGTCRSLLAQEALGCLVSISEWGVERAGSAALWTSCSCARALPSTCLCFRAGGAGLQWGVPLPGTP